MLRITGPLTVSAILFSALAQAAPVNINTASAEELAKDLKGVGKVKAEAIVADRKAHGAYKTPQDLTRVDGIGPAIYADNKQDIKVGK